MVRDEHAPYLENLPAYAIGALDADEVRALEAHLATCASCRTELADYRSLSESLRTLPVHFRNSFAPESSIQGALDPEAQGISFSKPSPRGFEGEVQDNTRWLVSLLNNLEAIRGRLLASPDLLQLADVGDVRRVHAEVRKFMEELYLQNSGWMLRDPNRRPIERSVVFSPVRFSSC